MMENCCLACTSMSFCLLQELPLSLSRQRSRIRNGCISSLRAGRLSEHFECFELVSHAELGRKSDFYARASKFTGRGPFHCPGSSFPFDRRRENSCSDVKSSLSDNSKELVGNSEDQLITKVSHRLSLVDYLSGQHSWKITELRKCDWYANVCTQGLEF
jgi:hypothetical protein